MREPLSVTVTAGSVRGMSEFQPLIDELYREEVRAARAMTQEQRMEMALKISEDNLAAGAGPQLDERLARLRAWNDARCYAPLSDAR